MLLPLDCYATMGLSLGCALRGFTRAAVWLPRARRDPPLLGLCRGDDPSGLDSAGAPRRRLRPHTREGRRRKGPSEAREVGFGHTLLPDH